LEAPKSYWLMSTQWGSLRTVILPYR
jgi:hypothetical protein